ncbi:MAG: RluA family pseudouridine synthase [Demequinaceae bacterium]|nr:RluA family pseudouridine synthase [Demequinaceae bacterium]
MSERRSFPVPEGLVGERADTGLARLLGISRTRAALLADSGAASVDGRAVGRSDRLTEGLLEVDLPDLDERPSEPSVPGGLTIVYEDDDILVVDKPVGVAAHPSPGWTGPTVVGALAAGGRTLAAQGAAERQGIVHRLDAGTSGLMVVAKSNDAYRGLKRAFKERTVEKIYHALAQGHLDPGEGTIDAPIGRHPTAGYKFAVTSDGRESVTHYRVVEMMPSASLLEILLETGRTHQIRVHMSALRHPLVGDLTYGADPTLAERLGLTRQWLHAHRLAFAHPVTGRQVEFESPYPADLARALDLLRVGGAE